MYSQATKGDVSMIVPGIYLFFILPLVLLTIIIASIVYIYFKQKNKTSIFSRALIAFFLLLMLIQYLLFSNDVLVR